jgi:soluble lytic murein transglycosylase
MFYHHANNINRTLAPGAKSCKPSGKEARVHHARLLASLSVVILLTALSLFLCVYAAGNTLINQQVFPQGTVVNHCDIGGMTYEEGLTLVLDTNRQNIEDLHVRIHYNGHSIELDANELGIVECVEQLLRNVCYSGADAASANGGVFAILRPKQGQVIDTCAIFDKDHIESALQTAVSTAEFPAVSSADGIMFSQEQPIFNLEHTMDGAATVNIYLTVNVEVLQDYVAHRPGYVNAAGSSSTFDGRQLIQYQDIIDQYAHAYGLDPAFVAATIFVESSFRPSVESYAGAIGLMQIMPSTGMWIAGKIGIEDYKIEMLLDPDINVQMGCWYLSYLLDLFDGNEKTASAAYNAGPRRVQEWLADDRYSTDGENLSVIPYEETKAHVERITSYYEIYKGVYQSIR